MAVPTETEVESTGGGTIKDVAAFGDQEYRGVAARHAAGPGVSEGIFTTVPARAAPIRKA